MRTLGLDYGEKRIGVALSDPLGMSAQPQDFIPTLEWKKKLPALIEEKMVTHIVVGLPTNRHGEDTEQTKKVRVFAERLKELSGVEFSFWDERMSSQAVERTLIDANLRRDKRKQVIDSAAAAFILQGYLDSQ